MPALSGIPSSLWRMTTVSTVLLRSSPTTTQQLQIHAAKTWLLLAQLSTLATLSIHTTNSMSWSLSSHHSQPTKSKPNWNLTSSFTKTLVSQMLILNYWTNSTMSAQRSIKASLTGLLVTQAPKRLISTRPSAQKCCLERTKTPWTEVRGLSTLLTTRRMQKPILWPWLQRLLLLTTTIWCQYLKTCITANFSVLSAQWSGFTLILYMQMTV